MSRTSRAPTSQCRMDPRIIVSYMKYKLGLSAMVLARRTPSLPMTAFHLQNQQESGRVAKHTRGQPSITFFLTRSWLGRIIHAPYLTIIGSPTHTTRHTTSHVHTNLYYIARSCSAFQLGTFTLGGVPSKDPRFFFSRGLHLP